jgi:outer membrane protein insertion porin family
LERLGFFKEVEVDINEVPGIDDLVDIEYTVEEQHSGSIGASIGYSQGVGMILGVNLQQNNFLGTGEQVGIGLNRSAFQTSYNLSYSDPYYTEDGVSRGFNLFYRKLDYGQINVSSYSTNSYGLGVNFGYPISEIERVGVNLTYRNTEIKTGQYAVQEIRTTPFDPREYGTVDYYFVEPRITPLLDDNGYVLLDADGNPVDPGSNGVLAPISELQDSQLAWETPEGFIDLNGDMFDDYSLSVNYIRSTLNRGILATRGGRHSLSMEVVLPGSDMQYYKFMYNGEQLFPINDIFTFRVKGELGYGNGYGDTTGLPFFQNFYAGGFGSVRGFKDNTLGPLSTPPMIYLTDCAYQEIVNSGSYKIAQKDAIACANSANTGYLTDSSGKLVSQLQSSYPRPLGGNILIQGSFELLFALPFIDDQSSTRTGLFVDFGNVFNDSCTSITRNCFELDLKELRYSVGLGATWITAMGPLTFSISKPMNVGVFDRREVFQFSVGQGF